MQALITVIQSGAWWSVYGLMRVSNPNLAVARPRETKWSAFHTRHRHGEEGDISLTHPILLSVCPISIHLLFPPLHSSFLPSIMSAVAYYNLEMDFKRDRRWVPKMGKTWIGSVEAD